GVSAPLLRCHALTRRFGALAALNGVSLEVEARERRAIIGPNGAGKTTLFDLITGELTPSGGHVEFAGRTVSGLPPHAGARRGSSSSASRAPRGRGSCCSTSRPPACRPPRRTGWSGSWRRSPARSPA